MTRADFIQQVSKEQESLRRFLLALCSGDRNEADDIAQEALIKAYIALERYREEQKFSTWLFQNRPQHVFRPSQTMATL